jgi:hypothetical protein
MITNNLTKLGSIVQITYLLDIEENIAKLKIYDVLRKIERNERLLETFVDDENINRLIALYQKAVEYFSGVDDSRFEIYLNKLHSLFSDGRVMKIICTEVKTTEVNRRNRVKSMEVLTNKVPDGDNKRKSVDFSWMYSG